jgi:competence ComEA-like helix-hairpin-helix protein
MSQKQKLPKLGFLYLDYVLRFFDTSNFKGWPDKIEKVVYHWKNDKNRFIQEVKRKKIDILIGNIPATAYETFKQIAKELPQVRFVPSIETQFSNKSKENVTLFCQKHDINIPKTHIFYDKKEGEEFLKTCAYPKIIKRSYGPSNYGGYFVHKVNSSKEALSLMEKKKYRPLYIQDCIPLKADIRVMLIGHKPVCAFWRIAGEGVWITNTSQGGHMSYLGIPMGALELAVQASKAAKAEYWACDIAEDNGKFYILECATAFAAFPYIRDWIGSYLMWDFSKGKFPIPHVPLYSWEELGKIDSSLLRTMRHIGFSKYTPSNDGTLYVNDKQTFGMERTQESTQEDIPLNYYYKEEELPKEILDSCDENEDVKQENEEKEITLQEATLTDLISLHGMDEELAKDVKEFVDDKNVKELEELSVLETFDSQLLQVWKESIGTKKVNINKAKIKHLKEIKGIGKKLSKAIIAYRNEHGKFKELKELKNVEGIGKKKYTKIHKFLKI